VSPEVVKRAFDLCLAVVALAIVSPVLALVAFAARLDVGAPVLFRQRRAGRHGRCFVLLKFRTMRDGADLGDAERLTSLGKLLRRLSLDELPQLWNVVRGDMSMVGPRPLLPEYLDRYTLEQARRHDVLPGITGLAQVQGRNGLSWDEKFALDVWYVDHRSLSLDLSILWRTIGALVRGAGISAPGCATMPEFQGVASSGPSTRRAG
jgi:lipopolysaccharide/colanic/teichoic acid biosynthesis glycosyltransferase